VFATSPTGTSEVHRREVIAIAIAPDGTWLAATSIDGLVRIWDTAIWQQRTTFTGHTRPVTAIAIAPDGTWLATGDVDGTVRI
jgi:WD40 repeat protein